jgi:hypothetical protein
MIELAFQLAQKSPLVSPANSGEPLIIAWLARTNKMLASGNFHAIDQHRARALATKGVGI